MAPLGLLFLGFLSILKYVHGYGNGGGWTNAHATFYGGGDASGTMGKRFVMNENMYFYSYSHSTPPTETEQRGHIFAEFSYSHLLLFPPFFFFWFF